MVSDREWEVWAVGNLAAEPRILMEWWVQEAHLYVDLGQCVIRVIHLERDWLELGRQSPSRASREEGRKERRVGMSRRTRPSKTKVELMPHGGAGAEI